MRAAIVLALAAAWPRGSSGFVFQEPGPAYAASQLACARYREEVRSGVRAESGGRSRVERAGRGGVLVIEASPADSGVRLEAWFDSLSVWRESPAGRLVPDTDGLLGGRYRGTLTPAGRYHAEASPFVPDEVAEVADLGGVLADLFPPLPDRPLAPGEVAGDSTVSIRRLPDSVAAGARLARYRLERRHASRTERTVGDTLGFVADQVQTEEGAFVWHPTQGLLRWERQVTIETTIPAEGAVRRPVRARVEQRIRLARLPRAGC
ncbi:MAG TPA: hypothetical protein VNK43_02660 [Gemmatimonadales bacterium]|nr:hypothetical protein [Gemmatimonadales bacterium]